MRDFQRMHERLLRILLAIYALVVSVHAPWPVLHKHHRADATDVLLLKHIVTSHPAAESDHEPTGELSDRCDWHWHWHSFDETTSDEHASNEPTETEPPQPFDEGLTIATGGQGAPLFYPPCERIEGMASVIAEPHVVLGWNALSEHFKLQSLGRSCAPSTLPLRC